ncbi:MAG: hypothetical protein VX642_08815 [Bdellovibrionota bacterium]|nr:hypothetical protein [Bdellovibrionota bacterium]
MKKHHSFTFIGVLLSSVLGRADNYILDLSDSSIKSSGDLILNLADSSIHGPPQVASYQAVSASSTSSQFSIGDGSHGKFDSSTYVNFSENADLSGNVITINTDTYSALYFTSFNLESGWTIRPTGSKPLKIYSQSTVYIDGSIDCSGGNGEAGNDDETQQASGGTGVCGGANGGAGGYYDSVAGSLVDASNGSNGGSSVSGGGSPASDGVSGGKGGAGGGAYSQAGTGADQGVNPDGGNSGTAGSNFQNDEFSELGGGSGGSGGAGFYSATPANDASGGGGGAGGGSILIYAFGDVTVTDNGSILANGGNGGASSQGAGGGGAGGGGSIAIFSAGDIILNNTVSAVEGSGGSSNSGGAGGDGGRGRTWVVDSSGTAGGDTLESPDTQLVARGSVNAASGSFDFISSEIDLENTAPILVQTLITQSLSGSSSLSTSYASGNSSGFSPSYSSLSSFDLNNSFRYWRMKVSLNQDSSGSFSKLTRVGYEYTPNEEDEFNFVSACGLVNPQNQQPGFLLLIYLLPLVLFSILRFRKTSPVYA